MKKIHFFILNFLAVISVLLISSCVKYPPTAPSGPAPTFILSWGSLGTGNGQFNSPYGIAVDKAGAVYVTDVYNNRVEKFDSSGIYSLQWGTTGTGNGQFKLPCGVAADSTTNSYTVVYVADVFNGRIQKFSAAGAYIAQFGGTYLHNSKPLAVDNSGNIYTAGAKFNQAGVLINGWNSSTHPYLLSSVDVAADNNFGIIYVINQTWNDGGKYTDVQKYTNDGVYIMQWGNWGSGCAKTGDGYFNGAAGIAVDSSGFVYVADFGNNRIQKFDSSGNYITQWGSSGAGNGQFNGPIGVAVDSQGAVYVVDSGNNRIQKFVP